MKVFKTEQNAVDRAKRLLATVFNGSPSIQDSWIEGCTAFVFIPYVGGYHVRQVNGRFSLEFDR
jgi:hypothetical protein